MKSQLQLLDPLSLTHISAVLNPQWVYHVYTEDCGSGKSLQMELKNDFDQAYIQQREIWQMESSEQVPLVGHWTIPSESYSH